MHLPDLLNQTQPQSYAQLLGLAKLAFSFSKQLHSGLQENGHISLSRPITVYQKEKVVAEAVIHLIAALTSSDPTPLPCGYIIQPVPLS